LTDHSITLIKELGDSDENDFVGGDHQINDDMTFRELLEKSNEKE
jgi:hypothetical protein